MSESRIKLVSAVGFLIIVTIICTSGLAYFEDWTFFKALWVTIPSLTTTGYGDTLPSTTPGRMFLLTMLLIGVGVVAYSFGAITNVLVENQISRVMGRDKMIKTIQKLNNHIIVCGAGRVGSSVAQVLKAEGVPYVMIEQDEEIISQLEGSGQLALLGDATQDEILDLAGICRARGIVCALSEDAYNVFITLSARDKNPGLKIVARAERQESINKLRRAGADKVISPANISGHQMAMAMLKPATIDMVDTLFTSNSIQLQVEEVMIMEQSILANKEIKDVFNREKNNVIVVSIIRKDDVIMNPRGQDIILVGDTLVIIGSRTALERMEQTGI